jgi:hypothetical protein
VTRVPLSNGMVALIDDQDAHLASRTWHVKTDARRRTLYAAHTVNTGDGFVTLRLHREVLGITDPSVEVDHKNGDGLDCRRNNLRVATLQQNQWNVGRRRDNTSGFKGVSWRPKRREWVARIREGGRQRHVAYCKTAEDAARAYDAAARRVFGDFAFLNFPEGA